ncbi:hypothetical protein MIR68_006780 [Amoeboaphelidium protococcarum]|nr:hypothetical protein MIR68_006780 [Amoeboaphelidium protococcarum]
MNTSHVTSGVRTQKKKKPSTRSLPFKHEGYENLVKMEHRLGHILTRKRLDFQEALGKLVKYKRTLRFFISNTAQYQNPGNVYGEMTAGEEPSWTLKVEGRLLSDGKGYSQSAPVKKMTHFVKQVVIELQPGIQQQQQQTASDGQTNVNNNNNNNNNTVVWRKQPGEPDSDGFELKRLGSEEVQCRLHIYLDYGTDKFRLSPELARLLNLHSESRTAVVLALWQYIKSQHLLDPSDPRVINCDAQMKKLFGGRQQFTFPQINELLMPHLSPPDPISIDYQIKLDRPLNRMDHVVDVEVELDDSSKANMMKFVLGGGNQKDIAALDAQIIKYIGKVNQHLVKRDFMNDFAEDPAAFINKWIDSQAYDLDIVLNEGNSGELPVYNREVLRRSAFYREEWVGDAVWKWLNTAQVFEQNSSMHQQQGADGGSAAFGIQQQNVNGNVRK